MHETSAARQSQFGGEHPCACSRCKTFGSASLSLCVSSLPRFVMSRCSECNAAAFQLIQPKEAVRGRVSERVFELVQEFWECGSCHKVVWMGPKSHNAIEMVQRLLPGAGGSDQPQPQCT